MACFPFLWWQVLSHPELLSLPVSPEVPVEGSCARPWKSTQFEQDVCSGDLWAPSRALATTSWGTIIPCWHAAGKALPLLPAYWESHSTSVRWLEPLSILCIACLGKLPLLVFKMLHSRELAQNGEPLWASSVGVPLLTNTCHAKLPTSPCMSTREHALCAAAKHTRLSAWHQSANGLWFAFIVLPVQCFCLSFPAISGLRNAP